jgi:hypothetical protein
MFDLGANADLVSTWREECAHKQTLFIETIDRVPVAMLIALIDHAFPPATIGGGLSFDPVSIPHAHRNGAEQEWSDVWKRHERAWPGPPKPHSEGGPRTEPAP